jgi:uncharacterized protein (TIGR03000 family)
MYSVVLLMALSGGAEAPDCHKTSCSGCTGYVVSTCTGCSGSCHGGGHKLFGGGLFGGHKHSSCCGGSVCCGGYVPCSGYVTCSGCTGYVPCSGCTGGMAPPKMGEKLDMPKEKKDEKKPEEVNAPATIVLSLPADAKVAIDGVATTSTSTTRTFVTPELVPAKEFVYVLSAEIVREGQKLTVSEQVTVRAGEQTRVTFGTEKFTATTVAAK